MSVDLSAVPHKPGIYRYYDKNGELLYVGKAKDLKSRVSSYFQKGNDLLPKTRMMVGQIERLETIIVESEIEALLLEAELIRQYQPKYNSALKDDKSFIYIHFTKEEFARVIPARLNQIQTSEKTVSFGPYTDAKTVKETLKNIRRTFPYRSCNQNRFAKHEVCLYYHLSLCQGPCAGKISLNDYQKEISYLKDFLKGKSQKVVKTLKAEMKTCSDQEDFEQASKIRDQLESLDFLRTKFRLPEQYIQSPNLIEDLREQTLLNLQRILNLPKLPIRIECYDISNFQGKEAVGSMVVFTHGESDKKEYRRFKIRTKDTPDDFHMMQEMVARRFKHSRSDEKSWPLPDLVIIDGGAGQLSSIHEVMSTHEENDVRKIPLVSLAKREEEIYTIKYSAINLNSKPEFHIIRLSKKSPELQLFQRLRDEAHRFAITYHRKLRGKKALEI